MNRAKAASFSLVHGITGADGLMSGLIRPVASVDCPATVDIWCAVLEQPRSAIESLKGLLSKKESEQAEYFRSALACRRFIVRRASRRLVLAPYRNRPAGALIFVETAKGKPALDQGQEPHFNCSASGDLALIGVTKGRRVGVDVEQLRVIPDTLDIARRFFTEREFEALSNEPASQRSASFLRLWTCKEAWTKATGAGLSRPFDSFEIDCDPVPRLKRVDGDQSALQRWLIQRFVPARGFIGAVAVETPVRTTRTTTRHQPPQRLRLFRRSE